MGTREHQTQKERSPFLKIGTVTNDISTSWTALTAASSSNVVIHPSSFEFFAHGPSANLVVSLQVCSHSALEDGSGARPCKTWRARCVTERTTSACASRQTADLRADLDRSPRVGPHSCRSPSRTNSLPALHQLVPAAKRGYRKVNHRAPRSITSPFRHSSWNAPRR